MSHLTGVKRPFDFAGQRVILLRRVGQDSARKSHSSNASERQVDTESSHSDIDSDEHSHDAKAAINASTSGLVKHWRREAEPLNKIYLYLVLRIMSDTQHNNALLIL